MTNIEIHGDTIGDLAGAIAAYCKRSIPKMVALEMALVQACGYDVSARLQVNGKSMIQSPTYKQLSAQLDQVLETTKERR